MTLIELKQRHESGTKQITSVRAKITQQLNRKCSFKECSKSLAFTRSSSYCSKQCCNKQKYSVRKANKLKKKNYYEKHDIKFDKTIRNRKCIPSKNGVTFSGQTLLYEHYKEPLKLIEKNKGFGYYGTVALTSDKQYVQCHICGNLYPSVSAHLAKHKITAAKYKEMFQLSAETALISEPVREAMQKRVIEGKLPISGELPIWLQEYNKKVQTGEIKHKAHGKKLSLEWRNKKGLCPDQVLEKIKELADKLGHTPSSDEFIAEYKGRFMGSIRFQHGSYLNAVSRLGMKSAKELKEHTREDLLESLIEFKELHGRIPMTSDFSRGLLPSRGAYFRLFGSLNNARVEAGLNAILPMPFGKIVELTPEEYIKYQERRIKS